MTEESGHKEISSTQYLDAVKVLPLLFKPMQKKLLGTKTNLQNGIDQVQTFTRLVKIKQQYVPERRVGRVVCNETGKLITHHLTHSTL